MSASRDRSIVLNRITIALIFAIETFIFLLLTSYKYYINYPNQKAFSTQFLHTFFTNYNILYTGNIIIMVLLAISAVACIKLFISSHVIKEGTLRIVLFLELITFAVLIIAFLTTKETFNEFTGRIIELDAKGLKILTLSVFILLKLFCTISLLIVSFSVLKKFYVFRAIWFSTILLLVSFIFVFFIINTFNDDSSLIHTVSADAGVILGAAVWGGNRPSPILRERINKGYELYKDEKINKVVLTGGGYKGDQTEADVAKTELMKKGIPEKNIFTENRSSSTLQQITFIERNFYRKHGWKNLVLISDNFHLYRAGQICDFFGIKNYAVASDTPISTESGFNFTVKETFAVIVFWLFGIG